MCALKIVEFEGTGVADEFLLFKELSDAAKQACCVLLPVGVESNSLLTYLLGAYGLNPMSAHYYCRHCGFYREEPKVVAGIDLPMKCCPQCGKLLHWDGFSLRQELVWAVGRTPGFEYRAPKRFHRVAQKIIERHYAEQGRTVVLCGWSSGQDRAGIVEFGWMVLPEGKTIDDYPSMQCMTREGKSCLYHDCDQIQNERIKHILFHESELLDRLDAVQWESGVLLTDIPAECLAGITYKELILADVLSDEDHQAVRVHEPMTFQGVADCISAAHNTWQDPCTDDVISFQAVSKFFEYRKCPFCTRDDVFDYLCKVYRNEDQALIDTENLRKGRCRHDPERFVHDDMPRPLRDFAKYVSYLAPRAYGQQTLLQYMRLVWYSKLDHYAYRKAVWEAEEQYKR